MRVLVVGPGVIGTVIAARLARSGHEVTVFGRGERLRRIASRGLRLWNGPARQTEHARVDVSDRLEGHDPSLCVVAVRAHQWAELMPRVAALSADRVLTLVNHGGTLGAWHAVLGTKLVAGFPGLSGVFDGEVVTYALAPRAIQPTTIGEVEGSPTPRVHRLRDTLEAAGIPTRTEPQMEAWLRCHAGWMAPIMAATLACHGEPEVLLRDRQLRALVVGSIRESFAALEAAGVPLTPRGLETWRHIPVRLLTSALALAARRPELAGRIRDAGSVRGEAEFVMAQLFRLFAEMGRATPHWNALRRRADLVEPEPTPR